MNNLKKRLTALILFACVSLTAITGCSNNNSSSSSDASSKADGETTTELPIETITNAEGYQVGYPFQSGPIVGSSGISSDEEDTNQFNNKDPEAVDSAPQKPVVVIKDENGETVTEAVPVTDANGEAATYAPGQPVTDAQGQPATYAPGQAINDEKGQPATYAPGQTITDAQGKPVTNESGENATAAGGEPVTAAGGEAMTQPAGQPVVDYVPVTSEASADTNTEYRSKTDGRYFLWMDISKDENFYFNNEFIKITFKVKEDIPDGDYPITLEAQFSSIVGQSVKPTKVTAGTIRVGGDTISPVETDAEGFQLYADKVNAKKGDTIDYYINIKNNPGLAAILMWVYYDCNALEFVGDPETAGEFANIAISASSGAAPAQSAN